VLALAGYQDHPAVFRKIRQEHAWFQVKELAIHGTDTKINE
jgi:hypothetical protein